MAEAEHSWCAGLRVTGSRSLTTAEVSRIQSRRRTTIARAWVSLLGAPGTLLACGVAIASSSTPVDSFLTTAMVVLVMLGVLLGVPLCIVIANDYFKCASVLKRQIRSAEVLVCEGRVEEIVVQPREMKRLRRHIGHTSRVVLEVLKQSGFVWAVNGHRPESWIVAAKGRTAGRPAQARLAAQYVRPVETEAGTFRLHQRPLSEGESAELQSYVPRLTLAEVTLAILSNGAAAAHLVVYLRTPSGVPVMGVLLLMLAVWCDAHLAVLIRARLRIQRDVRDRFVVIYQSDPALTASEESVVEFLPHSGATWTAGGRAASWRRLHGEEHRE